MMNVAVHRQAVESALTALREVDGFVGSSRGVEAAVAEYLRLVKPVSAPRSTVGLTAKQSELLQFIKSYSVEKGVSPSLEEMADFLGQKSKSNIHRMVVCLEERGFIRRLDHKARSIVVIDGM